MKRRKGDVPVGRRRRKQTRVKGALRDSTSRAMSRANKVALLEAREAAAPKIEDWL